MTVQAGPATQHVGGSSSAPLDIVTEDPVHRLTALATQAELDVPTPPGWKRVSSYTTVTITTTVVLEETP